MTQRSGPLAFLTDERPIPRSSAVTDVRGLTTKIGDQASDLHLLVAGAGFEPATSGL